MKRNFKKQLTFEYWYMLIMIIYMAQMTNDTARMIGQLSGNPIPFLIPIILTGVLVFRNRIRWKNKRLINLLWIISGWAILQIIKQRDFSTNFLSYFFFFYYAIVIAYIHIKVYGRKFFVLYEGIVTRLSIISTVLWIICILVPATSNFFSIFPQTAFGNNFLYVFNWMSDEVQYYNGIMRNAGFSWEPGRYSIMICLAVLCNLYRKGISFNNNNNIYILLVALISTQSTTGYSLCLILYSTFIIKHISMRSFLRFGLILIPIIWGVSQLDFMYDKIKDKMEVNNYVGGFEIAAEYRSENGGTEYHVSLDRFVSMYYESINIINDPIIGYSRDFNKSYFGKNFSNDYGLTGGFLQVFGKHGIPFGLYLYTILFISSINISNLFRQRRRFAMAICLIVSSISYPIFCVPIFTSFWLYGYFSHIPIKNNKLMNKKNINGQKCKSLSYKQI